MGIIVTHPIQYQVPLYRHLAANSSIEPLVFYLTAHGLSESFDPGFGRPVKYDVPLLGGYEHILVPGHTGRAVANTPWGMFNPSLPGLIRRSNLDVLLVHGYNKAAHWLAYATALRSGIAYLMRGESHPDHEKTPRAKVLAKHALIEPLVRQASACLAIGKRNRQFYVSYGANDSKIFFCPYSVDTGRFATSGAVGRDGRVRTLKSMGLDPRPPLVLFAAKLQPWKRPADVVLAMDRLTQPANLVVIGDGPLRSYLTDLASRRPWMRVLGFVNQTEIAKWYGAADLFVLPSEREPWGLAVNEAMAAGAIPIVSDAVGCASDLVLPEVGWVYRTGEIAALARILERACQASDLPARRMAAEQHVQKYDIASTASGIETAVKAALGGW